MSLDDLVSEAAFSWTKRKNDKIAIFYQGKEVMICRGSIAAHLAEKLLVANKTEEQLLLARITGNFKRGNEKNGKKKAKYNH